MNQKILFILGIILALIGAALMIHGSLFGDRTIPAAITIGIVGIVLIATSKYDSKMENDILLNFMLGMGIGICVIAAYLMFKGWIETAVVILIMGIIMIGASVTIKRKRKQSG